MISANTSVRGWRESAFARFAVQFIFSGAAIFCLGGGLAWLLIRFGSSPAASKGLTFPPAFGISTGLLLLGSWNLNCAVRAVRIEKQCRFRRRLLAALGAATLFVGFQSRGLWYFLQNQNPAEASTGAGAFVFVFATLHGLHFALAILFLLFVTLRAFRDKYDHEYHWGVVVCAYFWHFLAIVWIVILGVLGIALL